MLIAGGGPVGLAAAIELGSRGVECVIVEPRVTVSHDRPRAKTTSARSMELFRRFGLARRIRDAAHLPVSWSSAAVFCTTLLGREITRIEGCFALQAEPSELFAEPGQQIPQPVVEEVLREAALELPDCELLLGWRLDSLEEGEGEVRVTLADETGARRTLVAGYVLGCDGPNSTVRRCLGVELVGSADTRPNFNMVFRAPGLAERHEHGDAIHYWILNPAAPALLGRLDLDETWWVALMGVAADEGEWRKHELIDQIVGAPTRAEIVSTDPWVARMLVAERYGSRRVFLAGDAAHLNPPWGGHGFNTGVGDAVNIGWKLAAVLDGWADPSLLDSYEAERKPVAELTIDVAAGNMRVLSAELADARLDAPGPAGESVRDAAAAEIRRTKRAEFHSLGLVLGYQYDHSAIVVSDGTPTPTFDLARYTPTARPGSRLPHAWLGPDRALYDLLGPDTTLLCLSERAEPEPLVRAAADRGVPLVVVDPGQRNLHERCGAPLVLVRPDQHVAWRGEAPADPLAVIDRLRGATGGAIARSG